MMTLHASAQAKTFQRGALQEKTPRSAILVEFFAVFAQGK